MSALSPSTLATPLNSVLARDLAEYCLRVAGPGRVRLLGFELDELLVPMSAAGCEVVKGGHDVANGAAVMLAIGWAGTAQQCSAAFAEDAGVLVLVGDPLVTEDVVDRAEQAALYDWQMHAAAFTLSSAPDGLSVLVFSRAGVLLNGPDDLLRAGYHGLAAALVRPGDTVLATDAARQNLWRIIQQQSRCRWLGVLGNPVQPVAPQPGLEWLDPSMVSEQAPSVDVVITHLPHDATDWAPELQRACAALVRSGRLVVALSLENGRSMFMHRLMAAVEQHGMVIDRAWWQNSAHPVGLAQFLEVPHDANGYLSVDPDNLSVADALVLMAVKVEGPGVEQLPSLQAPNIIAFQRDYIDASVVRLIVAMGLRLESAGPRRHLARTVFNEYPDTSADYGAALCVLLYDPQTVCDDGSGELLVAARRYIDAHAVNPTALRWQVSLAFAVATLYQTRGALELAAEFYERVLGFDVLEFSPLLGTKTIAAAVRLGWIHFGRGDLGAARHAWARGMDEARRLSTQSVWTEVVGNSDAPETFALPEFAAVMDEAGCLASALRLTAEMPLRPGLVWQWSNRSLHLQMQEVLVEQQRKSAWQAQLQDAKDWLDGQYRDLTNALGQRVQVIQALEAHNGGLRAEIAGITAELSRRAQVIERLEVRNGGLRAEIAGITAELSQRAQVIERLEVRNGGLRAEIAGITAELGQRAQVIESLEVRNGGLRAEIAAITAELGQRAQVIEGLEVRNGGLRAEIAAITAELSQRAQVIEGLEVRNGGLQAEVAGIRAAFRFAHQHAAENHTRLQQQLHDMQVERTRMSKVFAELEMSARELAAATGGVMDDHRQTRLPVESLTSEMLRLAGALQRLPLKRQIRVILRTVTALFGRK